MRGQRKRAAAVDLGESKARVAACLEAFGTRVDSIGVNGTWVLHQIDEDNESRVHSVLVMKDTALESFLKRTHDDAELLGVLIDEELSTMGPRSRRVVVARGVLGRARVSSTAL